MSGAIQRQRTDYIAPLRLPQAGQCPNLEGHALSWPHFANGRDPAAASAMAEEAGARPSKLQIRTLPQAASRL